MNDERNDRNGNPDGGGGNRGRERRERDENQKTDLEKALETVVGVYERALIKGPDKFRQLLDANLPSIPNSVKEQLAADPDAAVAILKRAVASLTNATPLVRQEANAQFQRIQQQVQGLTNEQQAELFQHRWDELFQVVEQNQTPPSAAIRAEIPRTPAELRLTTDEDLRNLLKDRNIYINGFNRWLDARPQDREALNQIQDVNERINRRQELLRQYMQTIPRDQLLADLYGDRETAERMNRMLREQTARTGYAPVMVRTPYGGEVPIMMPRVEGAEGSREDITAKFKWALRKLEDAERFAAAENKSFQDPVVQQTLYEFNLAIRHFSEHSNPGYRDLAAIIIREFATRQALNEFYVFWDTSGSIDKMSEAAGNILTEYFNNLTIGTKYGPENRMLIKNEKKPVQAAMKYFEDNLTKYLTSRGAGYGQFRRELAIYIAQDRTNWASLDDHDREELQRAIDNNDEEKMANMFLWAASMAEKMFRITGVMASRDKAVPDPTKGPAKDQLGQWGYLGERAGGYFSHQRAAKFYYSEYDDDGGGQDGCGRNSYLNISQSAQTSFAELLKGVDLQNKDYWNVIAERVESNLKQDSVRQFYRLYVERLSEEAQRHGEDNIGISFTRELPKGQKREVGLAVNDDEGDSTFLGYKLADEVAQEEAKRRMGWRTAAEMKQELDPDRLAAGLPEIKISGKEQESGIRHKHYKDNYNALVIAEVNRLRGLAPEGERGQIDEEDITEDVLREIRAQAYIQAVSQTKQDITREGITVSGSEKGWARQKFRLDLIKWNTLDFTNYERPSFAVDYFGYGLNSPDKIRDAMITNADSWLRNPTYEGLEKMMGAFNYLRAGAFDARAQLLANMLDFMMHHHHKNEMMNIPFEEADSYLWKFLHKGAIKADDKTMNLINEAMGGLGIVIKKRFEYFFSIWQYILSILQESTKGLVGK